MTPTERFTDNEERHHEARQRIESEYRFTDWLKIQLDGDSKLRADHDSAKEDARQRRIDEIERLESELIRKREELVRIDEPEFSCDDAVEKFAQQFIDWITKGETK